MQNVDILYFSLDPKKVFYIYFYYEYWNRFVGTYNYCPLIYFLQLVA